MLHTFLHPVIVFFSQHMFIPSQPVFIISLGTLSNGSSKSILQIDYNNMNSERSWHYMQSVNVQRLCYIKFCMYSFKCECCCRVLWLSVNLSGSHPRRTAPCDVPVVAEFQSWQSRYVVFDVHVQCVWHSYWNWWARIWGVTLQSSFKSLLSVVDISALVYVSGSHWNVVLLAASL